MIRKTTNLGRLSLLGACFALAASSHAVDIPTSLGTGADTWLDNDDPNKNGDSATNFGADGSMEVRNFVNVRMRYALVRFDISQLDPGSDFSGGTISLAQTYGANRSVDWNVYLVRDGNGEDWDELAVSYDTTPGITALGTDNAPAFDTDFDLYDGTTNPAGVLELIHTETAWGIGGIGNGPATMPTLALTTAIADAIAADTDGQLTFLLMLAGTSDSAYYGIASKESTEPTTHYPTLVLPNAVSLDTDGDGLPDSWEDANGLDKNDDGTTNPDNGATGNPDGDSADNLAEFNAGSDPQDILSTPTDIDADGLTDLWEDANFGNNDMIVQESDLIPQDGTGDPDQDLGTNADEEAAGSDPRIVDELGNTVDGRASFLDVDDGTPDGLNDWWEVSFFGDTSTATATDGDNDGDNATNGEEYLAMTDPNDSTSVPGDSDGDGTLDLWEDRWYGNNNGIVEPEDLTGTDGTTNPDGDAFTDQEESVGSPVGSDPNDSNSVPGDMDFDNLDDEWELDNFALFGDERSDEDVLRAQDGEDDPDGDLNSNEEEETAGTDPNDADDFIDEDEDDMNDAWEILYFGSTEVTDDPDGNEDGDMFSNIDEYFDGSNPNDINSVPGDIDGDTLPDEFEITYFGNVYDYDANDDPDYDCSTNAEEAMADIQTDPTDPASWPDTDMEGVGDGLGDGWEIKHFGTLDGTAGGTDDPGSRDTETGEILSGDPDNDGFTNFEELTRGGTNGNSQLSSPDGDDDDLPDGYELATFGTVEGQTGDDDSDGGGASNRIEYFAGTNPNDAPGDDPTPAELTTAIGNGADTMLTNDNQNAFYNPDMPHGDAATLEARNNTAARQRVTLLRFDTSTLGGDLSNLTLRISSNASPRTRALAVYALVDGDPDANWDEATTSYSSGVGLIASELDQINQFARDPKRLKPIGTIGITQGVTGFYFTDPNFVDLKSVIEANEDGDGVLTLAIRGADNNTFQFDSKEAGDGSLAPALVTPLGTVTPPPVEGDAVITSVVLGGGNFTMTVEGLASGSQYHVESMTPPATVFSAEAGSTFTASSNPEDVVTPADASADPTKLFRIQDGAAPGL